MSILPQIHALSGCATTASPFYIGKKSVVKTVLKHGPVRFANLSSVSEIDIAAAVNASHALVALWYNPTEKFKHCHEDLNLLRTRMASTKITPLSCLPPCGELFKENVKRVIWQVRLWTFASMLDFGGKPDDFGWEVRNGILKPVM